MRALSDSFDKFMAHVRGELKAPDTYRVETMGAFVPTPSLGRIWCQSSPGELVKIVPFVGRNKLALSGVRDHRSTKIVPRDYRHDRVREGASAFGLGELGVHVWLRVRNHFDSFADPPRRRAERRSTGGASRLARGLTSSAFAPHKSDLISCAWSMLSSSRGEGLVVAAESAWSRSRWKVVCRATAIIRERAPEILVEGSIRGCSGATSPTRRAPPRQSTQNRDRRQKSAWALIFRLMGHQAVTLWCRLAIGTARGG
jgi:hypothetical protein